MEQKLKRKKGCNYQSLFWPMILIGVGTAWLLTNFGVFTSENISVAFQLWPLLLIAIGIDLIFGRSSPSRGATIGLAFVGFLLAIMYVGPSLGLGANVERTNTTFDIPRDGAENLQLNIEAGIDRVVINPLTDSNNLIEADIWHYGEIDTDIVDNAGEKSVKVEQKSSFVFGFDFFGHEETNWQFNINPAVPLALDYEGGVGETTLDLSEFHLTDLQLNLGVGKLEVVLPAPQQTYQVDINGGIGEVNIDIPDEAAVQINVSTGIGEANLPSALIQVAGEDGFLGEDGTWQTTGFDEAENQIIINFDGGIGSLKIH